MKQNFSASESNEQEVQDWLESLRALVNHSGAQNAKKVLEQVFEAAKRQQLINGASGGAESDQIGGDANLVTDYVNTIAADQEPEFPGDEELERYYRRLLRWNAAIMVHRANRPGIGVGGHISTYASSATLYEVGFNHFFKGPQHPDGADQVFFQGHASPGMYARSFLEGRLTEADLDGFRQEKSRDGMPSYPHPRMMPEYWQFPTVSMGLGPINAIYQAQTNQYLTLHGIKDCSKQKVWAFLGDGEMDEVESRGQLQVAANDGLENLIFVVNCNLQRLDGPVRGNGKIIQELEAFFKGAGWKVIKVLWGRGWDELLAQDSGELVNLMNTTPDGDFQTYKANDGAYVREHFFGRDPKCAQLAASYTDEQIWRLRRGGHDYRKVYAAYNEAVNNPDGRPTVILAHTVKGYGLGPHFESRNATHQMKKLTLEDIKLFRDTMDIPISDAQLEKDPYLPPYYHPGQDDPAVRHVHQRRAALGGYLPSRQSAFRPVKLPEPKAYEATKKGSGKQLAATTAALSRVVKDLLRSEEFGKRVVLVIPDEARTFGMDSYFPTAKIYNPKGQLYTSVDHQLLLRYEESQQGQIVHVGINEAGAMAAFTAAGSSYATNGEMLIPFYIFYSMFGFQRTGDSIWAAADQMARGFMIGATAGRTTLTGEGLQHNDGHSHLLAATNPAVVSYDPAFGYELSHILRHGIERMYGGEHPDPNVIFYLTVYNEPIEQPAEPEHLDVEGLVRGIYCYKAVNSAVTNILASGVALPWAVEAQEILAKEWSVSADIWSVTSWNELARDGHACIEQGVFSPELPPRIPYLTEKLSAAPRNFVAVSDYMRAVPEQLRPFVPGNYLTLGTDGFGFSDTRPAARRFFKVDSHSIVVAVLSQLAKQGVIPPGKVNDAVKRYDLHNVNAGQSGNAGGEA